jgi:hypothetical protein
MILGLEIGMLIAGIVALFKGKFALTRNQVVEGATARVVGFVLLLPLPLAFAVGFLIGFNEAVNGNRVQTANLQGTLTLVEVVIVVACLGLAAGITLISGQKPAEKRPLDRGRNQEDEASPVPPSPEEERLALPVAQRVEEVESPPYLTSPAQPAAADDWGWAPQPKAPPVVRKPRRSSLALLIGSVVAVGGLLLVGGVFALYYALSARRKPAPLLSP